MTLAERAERFAWRLWLRVHPASAIAWLLRTYTPYVTNPQRVYDVLTRRRRQPPADASLTN